MKTRKKVLSLILTLCTLISMFAMPAMAADTEEFPVKVHVMTRAETAARFAVSTHSLSGNGTAFLPKNNSTGTNGNPCAPFTADTTNGAFVITNAPGATSYNVQLYAGTPGSGYRVATYTPKIPINNGASFYTLTIGQNYYFMISSDDVGASGCTATYSYYTF